MAKRNLIRRNGNTNTSTGFNFNYTLYMTLRDDWAFCPKNQEYDYEYISESGIRAKTLNELKHKEDSI